MKHEFVAAIEVDTAGRIHVTPAESEFPYIYREAMEVSWDASTKTLHSPVPREWTYTQWLLQIFAAAAEQGVKLVISPDTKWINVSDQLRFELAGATSAA